MRSSVYKCQIETFNLKNNILGGMAVRTRKKGGKEYNLYI